MGITPDPSDPFIEFMNPPPNETVAETMARRKRELDAQKQSNAIDETIKQARDLARKEKGIIKVLLLGQSGSGKSILLNNLRMHYAREDWEKEQDDRRAVILLAIVRSITALLSVVEAGLTSDVPADRDDLGTVQVTNTKNMKFTDHYRQLMIRLAPLRGVEAELHRRFGPDSELGQSGVDREKARRTGSEVPGRSWKNVLNTMGLPTSMEDTRKLDLGSVIDVIVGCKDDMKAIWDDKTVSLAVRQHDLQLPDSEKYFLDELDRIVSRDYATTKDDLVRAGLRTVGIQEHRIKFKYGPFDHTNGQDTSLWEWRIFKLGACRTSRAAWVPFFDNVNSIIFLSPVSVFDQSLEADSRINRLEDSMRLWTSICRSTLLAKTQLILCLSKCDLLQQKLKRGIKVKEYIPSYGDRPNEVAPFVDYLSKKFKAIQKQSSRESRHIYVYSVNKIDTSVVTKIVASVRDGVVRANIAAAQIV